jgi:cysteine-rich repeat protein
VETAQGTFVGFEACDDGNSESGDGCSSLCQFEPGATPRGRIGFYGGHLCVIRSDGSLECWNGGTETLPTGTFEQLALSAEHGCALRTDGTVSCWYKRSSSTPPFAPEGTFTQIDGDFYGTCGLREDGSITCWDSDEITLEQSGSFTRVDTNQRACGLTGAGDATCFPAYTISIPSGPFIQLLPEPYDGFCGLRPTGQLVCAPDTSTFLRSAPLAGFVQADAVQSAGCGLRPDGRAVLWNLSGGRTLLQDRVFIEVAPPALTFCCGLTIDGRAWCSENSAALPAE